MKIHKPYSSTSPARGSRARSGFTLLEVMMVVIILGILITIGISGLNIKGNVDKAKIQKTRAAIAELTNALTIYEAENNKYPPTLQILVDENVMNKIKVDGWGKPFNYNAQTGEITSPGSGTSGPITSKDL